MKSIFFLLMCCVAIISFAQTKKFEINAVQFLSTKQMEKNEYGSKDYYINIYKIVKGKKIFLVKHYTYQYGVVCNNVFKDIGTIEIKKDSLILKTHFTQKGHDPIPEWEKKIYSVKRNGEVVLVYNGTLQNGKWNVVQD
jgi:hypothetical protein